MKATRGKRALQVSRSRHPQHTPPRRPRLRGPLPRPSLPLLRVLLRHGPSVLRYEEAIGGRRVLSVLRCDPLQKGSAGSALI